MADETAELALGTGPELETATPDDDYSGIEGLGLDDTEQEQETEGGEGEGSDVDDELDDIEFEGKTYKLPKAIREGILRNKDYTEKNQARAERERELDAREQRVKQQAQASDDEIDARVALKAIDKRLSEFADIDWQAWHQKDPEAAEKAKFQMDLLRDQKTRGTDFLREAQGKRQTVELEDFKQRRTETLTFAQKNIKGWNPDLDKKITDFAVGEMGISPQYLGENINPTLYRVLHRAYVGDQVIRKTSSVKANSGKPPAKELTPVNAKTGGAPAGLADNLSADEWLKRRNAQVAKRSGR